MGVLEGYQIQKWLSLPPGPPQIQLKHCVCAGTSYYSSDSAAPVAAGFKQYCVPASLAPGWHGLELRYGKSPLDATSVFRFFVVDATEVQAVYTGGVPANQILWKVPAHAMKA